MNYCNPTMHRKTGIVSSYLCLGSQSNFSILLGTTILFLYEIKSFTFYIEVRICGISLSTAGLFNLTQYPLVSSMLPSK